MANRIFYQQDCDLQKLNGKTVAIIGYGSQGHAHALNLKDSGASIPGEFYSNGFSNALAHDKGILSMARTSEPNSASSQFFIMDEKSPHLDGQYAAFGKITKGLEVVDAISQVETTTNDMGHSDVPVEPVIIESIKINK